MSLVVTQTGTPGEVESVCEDTSLWPIGLLHGDLKITIAGGDKLYTKRFAVDVIESVTP